MQILDGKLFAAIGLLFLLWLVASVLARRPVRQITTVETPVTTAPVEGSTVATPSNVPLPEAPVASNEPVKPESPPNPDVKSPFKSNPSRPSGGASEGEAKP